MERYNVRDDVGVVAIMPVTLLGVAYCAFELIRSSQNGEYNDFNVIALIGFILLFLLALGHYVMVKTGSQYICVDEHTITKHYWYGRVKVSSFKDTYVYRNEGNRVKRIIVYKENNKRIHYILSDSFELSLSELKVKIEKAKEKISEK